MATQIFFPPVFQASDANGAPLSGALLYFYETASSTPLTVYQDSGKVAQHTNPVVADTAGMFAPIYTEAAQYKVVLKTSAGVTVQTVDPITVNAALLTIESTDAGASAAPTLTLYRNSASPAASDVGGKIAFTGKDSAGNTTEYGGIYSIFSGVTNGNENSSLVLSIANAGTEGATGAVLNQDGLFLGTNTDTDFTLGRNDNDGYLELQGGNDANGGKFRGYASSHATQAKDVEIYASNSVVYQYDFSATQHIWQNAYHFAGFGRFQQNTTDNPGSGNNTAGAAIGAAVGRLYLSCSASALSANVTSDGTIVILSSGGTQQGTISVSGATVSYNALFGSHWAQLADGSKPEILRGTICESIDQMSEWPGEGPEDRLPCFKISDTPGSRAVYGVFAWWDNSWEATNDAHIGAVGAYVIRIAPGVTVQRGDYIESDGKGCGRVQADDVMRSRTVAKVTSATIVETYPDGSYLVPCTLHCG